MNRKEREQLVIFKRLEGKEINQKTAAFMLKVSPRWIRRKFKRYKLEGDKGLIHKNRGQPSSRRWPKESKEFFLGLLREEWVGFGPTFVAEKLMELHSIKVSRETLRNILIEEGLWQPNKRRPVYRQRRERKLRLGILVQLDGSEHDWLEGRGPKAVLLVFIDDATSRILWLQFVTGESVEEVMDATRSYFLRNGKPRAFYVDRASVFKVNTNNPDNDRVTQFGRAMAELEVEMKFAGTPQAKGRVERFNKTAQDRLIKEMRLANITTIEAANEFAQNVYMQKHNAKFAIEPAESGDEHRPVQKSELNDILCIQSTRILQNDYTVSYNTRILQIEHQIALARPKDTIVVSQRLDGSLYLTCRNKRLQFTELKQRPVKSTKERKVMNTVHKPAANHPWRSYSNRNHENTKPTQMEVILG